MTDNLQLAVEQALKNHEIFIRNGSKLTLREYQRGPLLAILDSISKKDGRSIVVMFPRQSGKNELQAQLEAYLLTLFGLTLCGDMVKVSPTWKPQTLNAMSRLERVLQTNAISRLGWEKESGYIYKFFQARISFFSGQPRSNIVGATASLLLEVDEAQDVLASKYDKEIAPMAAARNATKVFWGTAWTSRTLLSRELRLARELEKKDGLRRTFVLTADDVAMEVEAYGKFVEEQVQRLGRNHPMVKTQYFSEEIDAEGGLFPPERQALMRGDRDETRKLAAYPREMAAAGLRRISSLVAAIFTDNAGTGPTMADGGALFNNTAVTDAGGAGHANLLTTALSASEWDVVSKAVYNQPMLIKNAAGYYGTGPKMAINPRYCLVPRALQLTAMKILYPSLENAAQIYSENQQRGQPGDVVTVPEWTDATDWAAVCDPVVAPAIYVGERFGIMPEIFIAGDELSPAVFMNDEHRLKVRHFLAVWVNDFRPLHKSNVAG